MSGEPETLVIELPLDKVMGDTQHFRLKGLPAQVLLRVRTPGGTEITAQMSPLSEVEVFCGPDRRDVAIDFVVPDSARIDGTLEQVAPLTTGKEH